MMFPVIRKQFTCAALCAVVVVGVTTSAGAQSSAVLPGETITEGQVNRAFGLIDSELVNLDVPTFYDGVLHVTIPFAGGQYELALSPHSNRSERYEVRVKDESGVTRNIAPGPVLTKRGSVVGLDGSVVAASLAEGLDATIYLPDGSAFCVAPVSQEIAGAPASLHVVYRTDSVLARPESGCGLDHLSNGPRVSVEELGGSPKVDCSGGLWMCEVAVDTDYEYFVDLGSTAGVENRINTVMNAVNVQYERDVSITHEIVLIVIYTSNNDPYTSSNPSTLLNQVRANWRSNHTGDPRDIVHMFTGRNLNGGVIGIAWVGVICNNNYGYGLAENISGASCRADLTAHEIGHNWNAGHCSCSGWTMNSYLTCANKFIAASINTISNYRNGRGCLSCQGASVCQTDIGFGGPGTGELSVCGGDLSSGTDADLLMVNGYGYGMAFLQVGMSNNPTSFMGGLLVPVPGSTIAVGRLDSAGALLVTGIQGGGTATWYVQVFYEDYNLGAPYVGISNAVRMQLLP